jgi:hypothetical protein
MSRQWWHRTAILATLVAAGWLIWKYTPLQLVRWQGRRVVTVCVESPQKIRSISFLSVGRRDEAERIIAEHCVPDAKDVASIFGDSRSTTFDPYDGDPVQITILMGGASTQTDRDFSYVWFKALIVVGVYADGRSFWKIVDVPNPRIEQEITIRLP